MNLAEAAAFRTLKTRVDTLEQQLKDLTRRMDDQSKAHRVIADDVQKTLGLKKSG